MQVKEFVYCDICGASVEKGREHHTSIEGSTLTVCSSCFTRIESRGSRRRQDAQQNPTKSKPAGYLQQAATTTDSRAKQQTVGAKSSSNTGARSGVAQNMELVDDYAERIRRAREKLGWSQSVLASRVKVSENIIKRIEGGKLRPTLELARKFEEVLGVKLLMPSVEEELRQQKVQKYVTLGEIVDVRIDR
ncbi:MAG: multiprotein bridging factor aMBF1 [Ignisphaera sp.]|nr:multiprotein bridging factor aMBF1 [Ignisphaera sp.]MCX8168569.1 multiprotein bridging factor aMBF1 [Ignisphaera sp.]MDW8085155.1 multiprotein bridging factor aMBF1 [Ignisphaera sp.]